MGEATPVLDTLKQYIDQYLKSAGFNMTSNEFYKWKKCIDNQNIKEDKGRKKARSQTQQARERIIEENSLKRQNGRKHHTTRGHAKATSKPAKATSGQ